MEASEMITEQKRAESVKQKRKLYQQQQLAIKEALCNLDTKSNNKIIFSEDSTVPNEEIDYSVNGAKKKTLFQSDEESEDGYNFDLKEQMSSELFQLQTKFKGDERFVFDKRFTDSKQEESDKFDQNVLQDEKQNEIEILEQVLGTKIKTSKQKLLQKDVPGQKMLRFDPTHAEHSKYQMKLEKHLQKVKPPPQIQDENESTPITSKEVFYQVTDDLKLGSQVQEGFSLRNLFKENPIDTSVPEDEDPKILKHGNELLEERNPFVYDSSEEEFETDEKEITKNISETQNNSKYTFEPLFFKVDDYRLQEGADFVRKIASESSVPFGEQRKSLKNIVKMKVKNNLKKPNLFKKKLGGNKKKKMNRFKKALKR